MRCIFTIFHSQALGTTLRSRRFNDPISDLYIIYIIPLHIKFFSVTSLWNFSTVTSLSCFIVKIFQITISWFIYAKFTALHCITHFALPNFRSQALEITSRSRRFLSSDFPNDTIYKNLQPFSCVILLYIRKAMQHFKFLEWSAVLYFFWSKSFFLLIKRMSLPEIETEVLLYWSR